MPQNLSSIYFSAWFYVAIYLGSSFLMALITSLLVDAWKNSWKRRTTPSLFLQYHPFGPNSRRDALCGYPVMPPNGEDKRNLWLFAFLPVGNSALLVVYALAIVCTVVRSAFVMVFYGGEENYQRRMRSY